MLTKIDHIIQTFDKLSSDTLLFKQNLTKYENIFLNFQKISDSHFYDKIKNNESIMYNNFKQFDLNMRLLSDNSKLYVDINNLVASSDNSIANHDVLNSLLNEIFKALDLKSSIDHRRICEINSEFLNTNTSQIIEICNAAQSFYDDNLKKCRDSVVEAMLDAMTFLDSNQQSIELLSRDVIWLYQNYVTTIFLTGLAGFTSGLIVSITYYYLSK